MTSGCEAKRHTGKIECRRYQGQRGRRQGGEELGEKGIYTNRSCRQCLSRSSDGRGRRQRRRKKKKNEWRRRSNKSHLAVHQERMGAMRDMGP